MVPEVHKLLCRHKKTALSAECTIVERCVNEVLQSEKKLKVHSLLKLYTNSHGIIRIKDFFMEFSEPSSGKCDEEFVKEFPYDNVSTKAKNEDLASLHCIPQDMLHERPAVKLIVTNVKNYLGTKVTLWI